MVQVETAQAKLGCSLLFDSLAAYTIRCFMLQTIISEVKTRCITIKWYFTTSKLVAKRICTAYYGSVAAPLFVHMSVRAGIQGNEPSQLSMPKLQGDFLASRLWRH